MKRNFRSLWPKMGLMLLGIHFLTGCNTTPTQYEPMDVTVVEESPSPLLLQTPVHTRNTRIMRSRSRSLPTSVPSLQTPGQSPSRTQSLPTSAPPLQTPGQ